MKPTYEELQAQVELLAAFRDEVVGVMNDSQGVAGWHLNGAIAAWDELFPAVPNVESPAASLAQVKADAGRAGLVAGYEIGYTQGWHGFSGDASEESDQYAERIRQGGTE